jgi:hypothetical protein
MRRRSRAIIAPQRPARTAEPDLARSIIELPRWAYSGLPAPVGSKKEVGMKQGGLT